MLKRWTVAAAAVLVISAGAWGYQDPGVESPAGQAESLFPTRPDPVTLTPPTPPTWRRMRRSRSRTRTEQRTIELNGRPVRLFREALPDGWQYPCTGEELAAQLRELPAAWTARLRSVRLTFHPEWGFHARTDRSRIEINYVVDAALRAPTPIVEEALEELTFGARFETIAGTRCLVWRDRESLRTYILGHILIHELGHHVTPPGMRIMEEEEWAEAFAFRYFRPPGARQVTRSH
jgi:hypothetical protein